VIATCRNPSDATELQALRVTYKDKLHILFIDLFNEKSIASASHVIKEQYGRLDVMINCSAVLHLHSLTGTSGGVMVPETSLSKFDPVAAMTSYHTNAIGAALMMKHFHALMLTTAQVNATHSPTHSPTHTHTVPVIANLSARVSSISDNRLGGWYSYRASKTALNQLTKTAAVEFGPSRKKYPIVCVVLHPGTVATQLSKPFQRNVPKEKLFTAEYSAECLLRVVDGLTLESTGHFYDYAGVEIPW
jgi:NAD(P)-dependent dehydrogenase (short-subunit alcohol dehydrogenase family)